MGHNEKQGKKRNKAVKGKHTTREGEKKGGKRGEEDSTEQAGLR